MAAIADKHADRLRRRTHPNGWHVWTYRDESKVFHGKNLEAYFHRRDYADHAASANAFVEEKLRMERLACRFLYRMPAILVR